MTQYPIAETFLSCQGEGRWTGALMHFIRFAGCTVGKPYTKDERAGLPGLQLYQERCTAWNGTSFSCDTNYRMAQKMDVDTLLECVGDTPRVCLTGGEPLMHDLESLLRALWHAGKCVHIETSGTKPFDMYQDMADNLCDSYLWVAVSPKAGFTEKALIDADELKILVDATFNEAQFEHAFGEYMNKVWLQPINDEYTLINENVQRCIELQKKYKQTSLSLQIHKILGVR